MPQLVFPPSEPSECSPSRLSGEEARSDSGAEDLAGSEREEATDEEVKAHSPSSSPCVLSRASSTEFVPSCDPSASSPSSYLSLPASSLVSSSSFSSSISEEPSPPEAPSGSDSRERLSDEGAAPEPVAPGDSEAPGERVTSLSQISSSSFFRPSSFSRRTQSASLSQVSQAACLPLFFRGESLPVPASPLSAASSSLSSAASVRLHSSSLASCAAGESAPFAVDAAREGTEEDEGESDSATAAAPANQASLSPLSAASFCDAPALPQDKLSVDAAPPLSPIKSFFSSTSFPATSPFATAARFALTGLTASYPPPPFTRSGAPDGSRGGRDDALSSASARAAVESHEAPEAPEKETLIYSSRGDSSLSPGLPASTWSPLPQASVHVPPSLLLPFAQSEETRARTPERGLRAAFIPGRFAKLLQRLGGAREAADSEAASLIHAPRRPEPRSRASGESSASSAAGDATASFVSSRVSSFSSAVAFPPPAEAASLSASFASFAPTEALPSFARADLHAEERQSLFKMPEQARGRECGGVDAQLSRDFQSALAQRPHPYPARRAEDYRFFPPPQDGRAQMLMLMELSRLRGEMMQLQLAASKPPNIIIQNKTEVAATTETNVQQGGRGDPPRNRFVEWLSRFFSSRMNQFFLLCGLGLGCYMLLEHWRHTWRMAQLRRRVDSNIVLRGVQMLEETIGVRRPSTFF